MRRLTFRPGRAEELDLLADITMAGVRSYDELPPASNLAELEQMVRKPNPHEVVTVAEENGEVAGFHGLVLEDDWVELLRFFLTVDRIGAGYGQELWADVLRKAEEMRGDRDRMRIISDPGAVPFYEKVGCMLEKHIVVDEASGFALGMMWYELDSRREWR